MPMITDWIFHPFRHLEGGHRMMHHGVATPGGASPSFAARRVIFLEVPNVADAAQVDSASLFAIGAVRIPRFYADVDMHELKLLDVHELAPGTGWGRVPTPMF
jgi:hypothetical protein